MIVGMDFGTTNTGAATFDGSSIHLIPLDPASPTPSICRTSIYMTRGREYYLGSTALNLYFNQNVGRPTRYHRMWVGEIMQVFAELPVFYRDVYVYEDEFSPGRLFLSIKTVLRNPNYYGTVFLDHWYSASDLAAIFMAGMKLQMDRFAGQPVTEIVLGRPVRFSNDPMEDKVAQSRLLEAAFKAGFKRVYLEYEPVAAALSYEKSIRDKETVLVFDFGGGTLDFTVMEVGGRNPQDRRVLATGGIPIAGDVFDQRLFRATMPRHLGEGDYFVANGTRYPIPAHIFDMLTTPQEVLSLNTPLNLEMLRSIHQGSIHKRKTEALLRFISSNYALYLFDLVEKAKRNLSAQTEASITLDMDGIVLRETATRARFEWAIQREYEAIRDELQSTLHSSGLQPRQIDRVIRTGGSSQIPLFAGMLNDLFGPEKVRAIDVFSSVTSGLAIRGYEIAQGDTSLAAYTPGSQPGSEAMSGSKLRNEEVHPIDLPAVVQRIQVLQEYRQGKTHLPEGLLVTGSTNTLQVVALPQEPAATIDLRPVLGELPAESFAFQSLARQYLLAATDGFKMIAVSLEALYVAQQSGPQGALDLLHLEAGDSLSICIPWNLDAPEAYLCLIAKFGQARSFDARLLAEHISKRPYFQLERRYLGFPAALLPCKEHETVVVATNTGRVARFPAHLASVMVYDAIKPRKAEEITAAGLWSPGQELIALSDAGAVLLVQPESLPYECPPAERGGLLRRNFRTVGFIRRPAGAPQQILVLTNQARLLRLNLPDRISASGSLPPVKIARMATGEKIIARL